MAVMRYDFRTELGEPVETEQEFVERATAWPSPRSVPLYERHGFLRQGDVMELLMTRLGPSQGGGRQWSCS
jgi:hypothetical protein